MSALRCARRPQPLQGRPIRVGAPPDESPEANARVDSRAKAERRRIRRNRARGHPRPHHRGRDPHVPVPAVQHPVRLDDGDAADRRLPVRVEIHLRLQPLLVPVLAAAVLRTRSDPRQRPAARRRRRVPPAARRLHRLHQARDRTARRPHPDDRRRAQHQRRSRSSASAPRISSAPRTAPASSGSSAGRRRCRTASSITRSIWSTTRSTTTRRSTPCRPTITS